MSDKRRSGALCLRIVLFANLIALAAYGAVTPGQMSKVVAECVTLGIVALSMVVQVYVTLARYLCLPYTIWLVLGLDGLCAAGWIVATAMLSYWDRNVVYSPWDGDPASWFKCANARYWDPVLTSDGNGHWINISWCEVEVDGQRRLIGNGAARQQLNVLIGLCGVLERTCSVDGLVVESHGSVLKVVCFHPLPSFYKECSWRLRDCGLFVTAQTMSEAVKKFTIFENSCCGVASQIIGLNGPSEKFQESVANDKLVLGSSLNESQRAAVRASQNNNLVCIWGPPGTGKTQTIVAIIRALQSTTKSRLLVTAPTHNAVDNVMRRYLAQINKDNGHDVTKLCPLRVSTEVRKVAGDLQSFTCDALVGQEIYTNQRAMQRAKERVTEARIIFTTCMGAGLGLLRGQAFDVVIVDEASQQTEPASLVPLVSGCSKAILVGDHVQLRPTVQNISLAVNFDVSLFEALYTRERETPGMAKIMLDQQYRMHSSICSFASREFYLGKLLSGIRDCDRPLPESSFPWPHSRRALGEQHNSRILFMECSGREDLGHRSRSNHAQAELCVSTCKLLLCTGQPSPSAREDTRERQSLAVLTPYTRQRELLSKLLKGIDNIEVSSIDGFQGAKLMWWSSFLCVAMRVEILDS